MQNRRDAGQEECRTGGMQDRKDAGKRNNRTGGTQDRGMQDMRNAGQEGCRLQDRRGAGSVVDLCKATMPTKK